MTTSGYGVLALRTWPVPYSYYRATSLSANALGPGARARALRVGFGALRVVVYPLARVFDRSNYMAVAARAPGAAA